tara:strand:- start:271 stop:480 length:210 start_codon:yes stop_codon:yes gene_type:complete
MTDSNWREDYKKYTNDPRDLKVLEEGAKSLAQSWHLQAMYNKWKIIKGIKDPEPPDCQSSFKEWSENNK